MDSRPRYLNVEEAAEYLGTGVRFVRRLVAERRIVFYKLGNHVRFTAADLDAFAEAGRVGVIAPGSGVRKGAA
ncbi:helix-turn-helix domain-containing protein [Nocardia carnea]|uniref:helix-turn-helix domain-containing protein n=1 Tax=Nocardia carnea TaxID=37328 RepID=UPI0024580958|nr:helix-turn-helix domain-containing protein [Nocardia carnea]